MRARFIDKDGHEEIRQVQEGSLTLRRVKFRAKIIDGDLCYVEESRG